MYYPVAIDAKWKKKYNIKIQRQNSTQLMVCWFQKKKSLALTVKAYSDKHKLEHTCTRMHACMHNSKYKVSTLNVCMQMWKTTTGAAAPATTSTYYFIYG